MARSPHAALILAFALGGFASAFAMRLTDPLVQVLPDHFGEDPSRVALHAFHFFLGQLFLSQSIGPLLLAVTRSFFGFSGALLLNATGSIVPGM